MEQNLHLKNSRRECYTVNQNGTEYLSIKIFNLIGNYRASFDNQGVIHHIDFLHLTIMFTNYEVYVFVSSLLFNEISVFINN